MDSESEFANGGRRFRVVRFTRFMEEYRSAKKLNTAASVLEFPTVEVLEFTGFYIGRAFLARFSLAEMISAPKGSLASGKEVAIKRFSQAGQVEPISNQYDQEIAALVGCLKNKNFVQLIGGCCEGHDGEHRYIGRAFPARLSLAKIDATHVLVDKVWEMWSKMNKNLVQLVGCCCEVYHFMPNGSLDRFLHFTRATNRTSFLGDYDAKLDDFGLAELYERKFSTRARTATVPAGTMGYLARECFHTGAPTEKTGVVVLEVATGSLNRSLHFTRSTNRTSFLGVSSALTYLHEECETQIIHRDVKACNILLHGVNNAKLGDFGLAELDEQIFRTSAGTATIPAGTMGYLAPEYIHTGVPTEKTDVYSFGVVVFEVATERGPVEIDGAVFVDKVREMWSKGKLMEAVDNRLIGRFEMREMLRMLMVGLACVHSDSKKRPKMKEAERILRGDALNPILPLRKPEMRIQSVSQDVLLLQGDRNGSLILLHGYPLAHEQLLCQPELWVILNQNMFVQWYLLRKPMFTALVLWC